MKTIYGVFLTKKDWAECLLATESKESAADFFETYQKENVEDLELEFNSYDFEENNSKEEAVKELKKNGIFSKKFNFIDSSIKSR